ncbi:MAG: ABC transporter substrate-binding protein [Treponemataceae bacterium]|nr:ABC transporter substrate-binding protein [Treponemataceae bacterium]MDE6718365.1 ABC transporter substrate-binding protein [Treponemataceae bacterium]
MKKSYVVLSTIAVAAMLLSVTSCGKKAASNANKLVVWSFTDELQTMIDKYYKPSHPGVEVEYSLTPTDQFPNKLDPVLASGNGAPDVMALENAFVRKYVDQGDKLLLDITDEYNAVKDKMVAYPAEIGTLNGRVYAVSWQVAPGAVFYRRSLAKKYLGTDDPAAVQAKLNDWNAFVATARELKNKSNGTCVIVSTTGDLFNPYYGGRKGPWVQGGKLVIDPAMEDYMDMVKLLKEESLEGRQAQWAEGWFAGMKGELKDESGKAVEVFSYFLPTWGLHYTLKPNAGDTAGDWAMCAGPAPYRWGGTWVAAYKGTKVPELAKDFLMFVGTDDGFLEQWAKDTGDVVSNNNVVNKIKDTYTEPFLGGQNHYAEFAEMANHVDGKLCQGTDQAIEGFWGEAVSSFLNGERSKADAIADFKKHVAEELGIQS